MIQELIKTVVNISSFSIAVPTLILFLRYRQLNLTQKLLSYLILSSLLTEIIANILWYQQLRNLEVYNAYALINFNLLAIIFRNHLHLRWRKPLKILIICFNGYFILDALLFKDLKHYEYNFNSNLTTAASIVLITLALCHFYKLLKEIKYQRLEKKSIFWINSGVILYYSGTLVLFLLSNTITSANNLEVTFAAWGLNSFFNLILNTAYSIALWVKPAK